VFYCAQAALAHLKKQGGVIINGTQMYMYIAFLIATVTLLIPTLLPMLRYEVWWVRGFDFPRLQLCCLLLVLLLLELLVFDLREPVAIVLSAVAFVGLAYQAWWILPYTRLFPVEVKTAKNRHSRTRIRLMTANVLASNRNAEKLLEMVRTFDPDILVTLESNLWWQQRLDILEQKYPFTIKCPSENLYGMHVYSRFVLQKSQIEYLVAPHIPSMHALVVLPSGDEVLVHFIHPEPPSPQHKKDSSERDAELVVVAKSVAQTDTPTIVTGDLNDVAWSRTTRLFRKISGLLDPRVGRGMFNTFHADYWFLRWPLDHLFHSDHFTLVEIHRLPGFGSDHYPLLAELVLEWGMRDQQEGLKGDRQDLQTGEEKMRQENVSERDVPKPDK
jgi:endonuclease/exonuclease/phosphatase (EEP) superfamily protein YafD